jgi:hypothetical protein
MVNFDEFGSVSLLRTEIDLDPYLYPMVFDAKWQPMKHVDDEYLLVSDTHLKNSNIGKYIVKIHPLKKLRE